MRLIDADNLKATHRVRIDKHTGTWPCVLMVDISEAPTIDAVPVVHGRWEVAGIGITERIVCSHCKSSEGSFMRPPFCNQCGARMDGGKA